MIKLLKSTERTLKDNSKDHKISVRHNFFKNMPHFLPPTNGKAERQTGSLSEETPNRLIRSASPPRVSRRHKGQSAPGQTSQSERAITSHREDRRRQQRPFGSNGGRTALATRINLSRKSSGEGSGGKKIRTPACGAVSMHPPD